MPWNAQGESLVTAGSLVNQPSIQVVNATPLNFGPFAISQIGYEGSMSLACSSVTGPCWVGVTLTWNDVNGNLVQEDQYFAFAGSGSQPHTITFRGPTKGASLSITIEGINSLGTSFTVDYFRIVQNNRPYVAALWRTVECQDLPGITNLANNNVPSGIVGAVSEALAISGTFIASLALWTGKVSIQVTGTQGYHINILNNSDESGVNVGNVPIVFNNTFETFECFLPNSQCDVELVNGGTAQTIFVTVTAAEY